VSDIKATVEMILCLHIVINRHARAQVAGGLADLVIHWIWDLVVFTSRAFSPHQSQSYQKYPRISDTLHFIDLRWYAEILRFTLGTVGVQCSTENRIVHQSYRFTNNTVEYIVFEVYPCRNYTSTFIKTICIIAHIALAYLPYLNIYSEIC